MSGVLTKTIIHAFPAGTGDGQAANANIVFDSKCNLYGTTYDGGSSRFGTVFELSPPAVAGGAWTETVLHSFTGSTTDGGYPIGGLIGRNGVIYGTASYSGVANDSGTAFQLAPPAQSGGDWTYAVMHTFAGGKDGATPATTMAWTRRGIFTEPAGTEDPALVNWVAARFSNSRRRGREIGPRRFSTTGRIADRIPMGRL